MAYEENLKTVTLDAEADHTGDQYKFVVTGTGGRAFALASTSGDKVLGVLQNKPSNVNDGTQDTNSGFSDGSGGTIAIIEGGGVSKVVTGEAIADGDNVMTDANGRAATAATGGAIVGIAQEAASASGEVIPVLLLDGGDEA